MPRQPRKNNTLKNAIAQQLAKRVSAQGIILGEIVSSTEERILQALFDKQQQVILSNSRLKSVLCSRRSGKSVMCAHYLAYNALRNPKTKSLYLGLTRSTAKAIAVPLLQDINTQYGLGMSFNNVDLIFTLPNGSEIICGGIDVDYNTMQRLRGQAYNLAIIDEAQSIRFDLESIVWDILKPATIDNAGTIVLVGTPGYYDSHYFYKATMAGGSHQQLWDRYSWTTYDNPHMSGKFKAEIDSFITNDPGFLDTPKFAREYLGKWVTDTSKLVYHYTDKVNGLEVLPDNRYRYLLGIDLGWKDATAFTLMAFAEDDPHLYMIESRKRSKMDIVDVKNAISGYIEQFHPDKIVIDGANAQFVESLRSRFALPLVAAEKRGKEDWIELFNTELIRGKVKILTRNCEDWINEAQNMIWDEDPRTTRRIEHKSLPNHCLDSALYCLRSATHYIKDLRDSMLAKNASDLDPFELKAIERWQKSQTENELLLGEHFE